MGDASQKIRRNAGMIPTVALCSQNVVSYLLNNEQLYKYLLVPSRENLALMSIQPKLVRPELLRVGYIESLNLEIYAYDGVRCDMINPVITIMIRSQRLLKVCVVLIRMRRFIISQEC